MYGKALTDQDINNIKNSSIDNLNIIALNAYKSLIPIQKLYCDYYLELNNEKQAAINAGYSVNAILQQLSRIRKIHDICLFISAKQEIINREKEAEIKALTETKDADISMSKDACRLIIGDPESKKSEILAAIDILAKLNGVYKEKPNESKNKAFSIKKPENESKTALNKANKSKRNGVSIKGFNSDNSAEDEE